MVAGFSARTAWDRNESELAQAVREARARAESVVDLTVSNPTVCGFRYDGEAILAALSDAAGLAYDPNPVGMLSAREAVAAYYAGHGAAVGADTIVLTTSTSEAYSFLFRLLCDAGDRVLVAQPGYPLFDFLAVLEDVRLETYPTFYDYGWSIDFAELERRVEAGKGRKPKALVLVHPNNPTGHATTRGELKQLQEMCARHGMALIVDEVFLDYGLERPVETVAAVDSPGLTFVVSGLSKVAALPQMKVAWIVCLGPEALKREATGRLEVIADTFLSLSAPAQLALPRWLATRAEIQHQILERVRANLASLAGRRMVQALRVEAAWNAVLRLPQLAGAGGAVELVREHGVVVHPGSFYAMAGDHFVVVSTIVPAENFKVGLDRLESWCASRESTFREYA